MKMNKKTCHVSFHPSGKKGSFHSNATIKEAAKSLGEEIEGVCGEQATCGKCKVYIVNRETDLSSTPDLSPITDSELDLLSREELEKGCRLACQAKIMGDIEILIPDSSRKTKQIIRKEISGKRTDIHPAIKSFVIELEKPGLNDMLADWERLSKSITEKYGLTNLTCDHQILKRIQKGNRDLGWKVKVDIKNESEIINLSSSEKDINYGIAFDIGTTTVVGYLCNLNSGEIEATGSRMNPQVVFGDDVISRIVYIQTHPGGLSILNKSIIECMQDILVEVSHKEGIALQDILDCVVVCNTCMHHIFLSIDPVYLGRSPFIPAIQSSVDVKARDLGLSIAECAYVHVLPIEAGFVGADNVAVLLATINNLKDEVTLILDIGTNGEIILTDNNRFLSASCATGPAFEGGEIKHGMRASHGAIDHISFVKGKNELILHIMSDQSYEGKSKILPSGICGSGIIDGVVCLYKAGVIDHTGRFISDSKNPRLRKNNDEYEYVLTWETESLSGQKITITQSDIRAIQLAKGALLSGAKILMKNMGVDKIDRVILAGAFGSYIDKESALSLGLFPDCDITRIDSIGNAAGEGACIALLNLEQRVRANHLAKKIEYLELTTIKDFTREFAKAMWFPKLP